MLNELNMKPQFVIERTRKTPYVFFDPNLGKLEISGYCLPTNSQEFFYPLFVSVEEYLKEPLDVTELVFSLEYFNTSSSKIILQLLLRFQALLAMGKQVTFFWYIDEDDFDMHDAGKTYEASINIPTQILINKTD